MVKILNHKSLPPIGLPRFYADAKRFQEKIFNILPFFFCLTCRASSLIKLHHEAWSFSPAGETRPWIRIHLKNTKTKKKHSDDEHTVIFYKNPNPVPAGKTAIDGYSLALLCYHIAKGHGHGFYSLSPVIIKTVPVNCTVGSQK